jgi:hypothetical protein
MQIAGNRCFVCGQNIGVMRDGTGCMPCQIVIHKTCNTNQACPKCNKPLLTANQIHSRLNAISERPLNRPTSVTVIAWLAFLGVLRAAFMTIAGVMQMATDMSAGVWTVASAAVVGILSLALGLGLLNGYGWAPKLYLWSAPVAIAIDLGFGDNGLRWPRFSVAVAGYCVWAYLLTRPKAVAFFRSAGQDTAA